MINNRIPKRSQYVKLAQLASRLELIEQLAKEPATEPIETTIHKLILHNRNSQPLTRSILVQVGDKTEILEIENA